MKLSQELELEFFGRLIKDPEYIVEYQDLLQTYKGSSFAIEWIKSELLDWSKKYEGVPPKEFWVNQASNKLSDDSQKQVLSVISFLLSKKADYEEYAKDCFLDFISSSHLNNAIEEGQSLFKRSLDMNLYMSKVSQGLTEAEKIKNKLTDNNIFDWLDDRKNRESRREIIDEGLKLGIPLLDNQFVFKRKTVSAFLGAYKRYKSILLHHCGFAGLLQGYNVLHVSYENSRQQVGSRYDSRFTGVNYKNMTKSLLEDNEISVMNQVFERLENLPNRLKIELCTPYVDATNVIKTCLLKLRDIGWMCDILIVDYIGIMASNKQGIDDDYKRIELACWDLKILGVMLDLIIITAAQTLKGAEEKKDLDGSDTAGSVGLLRALDNKIAINQTSDEQKMGIIRLSPIFFRDDEIVDHHIPLNAELTRMCISRESDALWNFL